MKKKLVLAMAATMAITSCAVPVLADDAAAEGGKIGISLWNVGTEMVLIWKNSLKQLDMM
jgi:ABC-type proline/glycine betaine transport system substrate-binding protein